MIIKLIDFSDIKYIWETQLWPGRTSPIKTHSSMTWPYTSTKQYDMNIFTYPVYFWGVYINDSLAGVNSGHLINSDEFRSRGLWVDPQYRRNGIASILLTVTKTQAKKSGAKMIWTMPRESALPAYQSVGFSTIGNYFKTETSEKNIYAYIML